MRFIDAPFPVIVLVGPTAVGKTALSIPLAISLGAEIVSVDSRLFYRGMDIGTAKPGLEERDRVPHHLIDVADPDENWSLAVFQKAAREVIGAIHERGKLPLLVGGTGQYIRAVIEGWQPPAQEPDQTLRNRIENWANEIGFLALHQRLAVIDPPAAARIDARNMRRTIRALEVIFSTGRRFSDQIQRKDSPYTLLQIGLKRPRSELYARIDARIDDMFDSGLLEEVRELLAKGYAPDLPSFSAIGYRETIAVLQNRMTVEEAKTLMRRLTRQFVRRQANWFKETDSSIHWYDAEKLEIFQVIDQIQKFDVGQDSHE